MKKNNNITTLKLEKETKERLEKLREHKRETYDDIIRKIMYVLNTVRDEPIKAKAILEFIDEKRKRMFETSFSASTNDKIRRRAESGQSFEDSKIKNQQIERARSEKEFRDSQDKNSANGRESPKLTETNTKKEQNSPRSIPNKTNKGQSPKTGIPTKSQNKNN